MPPLTEAKVRAIKVSGKIEKYVDGYRLYIELMKAGSKIWRYKYRFEGKEKSLQSKKKRQEANFNLPARPTDIIEGKVIKNFLASNFKKLKYSHQ